MKKLILIAICVALVGCAKNEPAPSKDTSRNSEGFVDKLLAAALRENRATKVCYDTKNEWVFAYFPHHTHEEGAAEDRWQDWILFDTWDHYEIQNGSFIWANRTTGTKAYTPDITGLTCKTQKIVSPPGGYQYNDTSEHALGL